MIKLYSYMLIFGAFLFIVGFTLQMGPISGTGIGIVLAVIAHILYDIGKRLG